MSAKSKNLIVAVNNEDSGTVRQMLEEKENPNMRDLFDRTALMRAVVLEESDMRRLIVRNLINYGADVNLQDKHKRTALMYLCNREDGIDILKIILKACKVDYNIQDEEGNTALMYAIRADNHDALEMLLQVGGKDIDVDRENTEGLFPLYVAASQEDTDFCKMLVEIGGAKRFHNIPDHLMQYLPEIPKELRKFKNPKMASHDRESLSAQNKWTGSRDSDPVLRGGVTSLRNTLGSILSRELVPLYEPNTHGTRSPGVGSIQSFRSTVSDQDAAMLDLARRLAEFEANTIKPAGQSNAPTYITKSGRVIKPNAARDPQYKEIKGKDKGKQSPSSSYSRKRIQQRIANKQKLEN
ncbi:uncharacterized protein [Antedon mediterranea]|uniref:uncharacterized protein n=1 Tax=Antedon mediterranea TaxID=105859 RepID=UPI003AF4C1D5